MEDNKPVEDKVEKTVTEQPKPEEKKKEVNVDAIYGV